MENFILKKRFEEQLYFSLSEETVIIGNEEYSPVEIIKAFRKYKPEFDNWLYEDWKPRQRELSDALLSYSANYDRYLDLMKAIERQQVVPFVGSGMSVDSGLPTWSEFLSKIGEFIQCDKSKLKKLIKDSLFEEAADLLAESTNPNLFTERIEHDLRILDAKVINGAIGLLPRLFENLVITTNLDDVLENLYKECLIPFEYVLSGSEIEDYRKLKNPDERFLLKLHGDCRKRKSHVLLSTEYEEAYGPKSPVREEIVLLYQHYSLLFLGCSLGSDRTVKLLESVAAKDANMPNHYAFLAKPTYRDDQISRENFLTERGIFPIWYDRPHEDSIMALLDGLDVD